MYKNRRVSSNILADIYPSIRVNEVAYLVIITLMLVRVYLVFVDC